ncbi:hypothetical protein E4T70_08725 [Lactobacillus johnsonii]|uniref:sunset domain-containing protein n=1 Tax=Lactobacillus johnsonii TaxID=33959 RepID=UPI0010722F17|nr:hypothetical protein [Lactobacillus johnsonii]MBF0772295.1 hypothetical protein [Lactobacillus johnsonii]MCF1583898.1 hypothetical protein [Lactobacillus johnsonii]MCI9452157.1 hypothetical protein [Lactobacillus johnsonii]MDG4988109.1 hypothetical protein [Lactobacillus johnsonii]NDO44313.1 hypothetical protein [Lactobacillus johnsonii]
MKNKLGCIGVIVLILLMLARCSSCAQSDVDSELHEAGIYKVEITKVQSKDGDFILKGKTDAPDGSKILAQGTYVKEENEASAVDDDNYAKVKDNKFTMQLDTNNSTEKEIEKGVKVKVRIFAIEKYSKDFDDYYLTKKVRRIIAKEIDPVTLTVTKKMSDHYVDEDDSDEEDDSDSDSDQDQSKTEDEEEDKSKSESEESEDKKEDTRQSEDTKEKASSQSSTDTSSANKNSDASAGENTNNSDESQAGKIYTGNSNKIVGNARTHKYHVPGQAGYNMNAANAVYFNSEEEAQAAGYVRSKR